MFTSGLTMLHLLCESKCLFYQIVIYEKHSVNYLFFKIGWLLLGNIFYS